ncbi:MAG: nuclear transport factor 2 family protein [Psychromonas sp.]
MIKNSKIIGKNGLALLATLVLAACSNNAPPASNTSQESLQKTNQMCQIDRDVVIGQGHEFGDRSRNTLKSAFKAAAMNDFDAFMAAATNPYIQHSPDFKDGWKPIWDLLINRPEGFSTKIIPWMGKEGFLDSGDFLVMFREVNRGDGTPSSKIIDLMKFDENGKYTEHWDIRQALSSSTASGRSEITAAKQFTDNPVDYNNRTEQKNARIAIKFLNQAFNKGNLNKALDKLVAKDYIQHNPLIADGIEPVKKAFAEGKIANLCYDIQHVLPQNDLVFVFSKVTSSQGVTAVVDILRIREGKLVEHWDVVQQVPPQSEIPHNNGVF